MRPEERAVTRRCRWYFWWETGSEKSGQPMEEEEESGLVGIRAEHWAPTQAELLPLRKRGQGEEMGEWVRCRQGSKPK